MTICSRPAILRWAVRTLSSWEQDDAEQKSSLSRRDFCTCSWFKCKCFCSGLAPPSRPLSRLFSASYCVNCRGNGGGVWLLLVLLFLRLHLPSVFPPLPLHSVSKAPAVPPIVTPLLLRGAVGPAFRPFLPIRKIWLWCTHNFWEVTLKVIQVEENVFFEVWNVCKTTRRLCAIVLWPSVALSDSLWKSQLTQKLIFNIFAIEHCVSVELFLWLVLEFYAGK